jgi:hypothetical protein
MTHTFWLGAAGCIKRAAPGSEMETQLRLVGRVELDMATLRKLAHATRELRIAYFAKAKGLDMTIGPTPQPLGPEEREGRSAILDDGTIVVDTPEGERIEYRKKVA